MRLLTISLSPFWGGAEHYLESVVAAAVAKGHTVTVASPLQRFAATASKFVPVGYEFRDFASTADKLQRICKADDVDVLHFNAMRAIYFSAAARLERPARRVATRHALLSAVEGGGVRRAAATALGLLAYRRLDNIICVSQAVYDDLPDYARPRAVIIDNGVEGPDTIAPLPAKAGIAYVGRLVADKGILDFLELAARLNIGEPAVRVAAIVAGDGPERSAVETAARQGGVDFRGFVRSTGQIYHASSLLVLPSRSEAVGLAILEAFAHGRPAVGYHVEGVRDVIRHEINGLLVDPRAGVDGLVQAVRRLLGDEELLRRLGQQARLDYEARYKLDRMTSETLAVLNGAAAR